MADALSELYRSLDSAAAVERLVAERELEGLHFEFKRKHDRTKSELDKEDSWQFSRALSGFANSDGGILVFGVGTDKKDGLDRASTKEPIVDHEPFVARLRSSLLEAVIPSVDGVEIDPIPSTDARLGYAKCLIPRSERTPHRGMLADREYYKRSPEGFHRLEHFDLEDMFGRRPVPRLSLSCAVIPNGEISSGQQRHFKGLVVPTIKNDGRGSARAPHLGLTIVGSSFAFSNPVVTGKPDGLTRHSTSEDGRMVFTSSDVVIHSDLEHAVTFIPVGVQANGWNVIVPPDLHLKFDLGAEDARVVRGELIVKGRDIAAAILTRDLVDKIP